LTAERFARQRLRALAKIEGLQNDGKPTVLFLCSCSCTPTAPAARSWRRALLRAPDRGRKDGAGSA
jgi:hypothetical protein